MARGGEQTPSATKKKPFENQGFRLPAVKSRRVAGTERNANTRERTEFPWEKPGIFVRGLFRRGGRWL